MPWLNLFGQMAVNYLNMGLMIGLVFAALILLRPVTNRLLRPGQRVVLWAVGWISAFLVSWYASLGRVLPVLPISFRSLAAPRLGATGSWTGVPMFLPGEATAGGDASIVLPGGGEISLPSGLAERAVPVLGAVFLVWFLGYLLWAWRAERRLRRLAQQGERLGPEELEKYGVTQSKVAVCLCDGLPASFVYHGHYTGLGDGVRHVICLQRGLPPERLRLVLLHELEHIRQRHSAYKGWVTLAVAFHAWNPVMWLACRLTCRDMELACDEAVLAQLPSQDRREYARTLVELGSGRHLWGSITSFGECDAALRVKNVAAWRPRGEMKNALSWLLAALLFLFFYGGDWQTGLQDPFEQVYSTGDWSAYVDSPRLLEDLREKTGQPGLELQEVWSRAQEQLVVLDGGGQWYYCTYFWQGEAYQIQNVTPLDQIFLDGYQRLA